MIDCLDMDAHGLPFALVLIQYLHLERSCGVLLTTIAHQPQTILGALLLAILLSSNVGGTDCVGTSRVSLFVEEAEGASLCGWGECPTTSKQFGSKVMRTWGKVSTLGSKGVTHVGSNATLLLTLTNQHCEYCEP